MTYIDSYESCSRTYATFAVYSGEVSPEKVSLVLGINPTDTSKAQEVPRKKVNGWFLSSQEFVESKDSRRHIDYLLNIASPLSSEIQSLQEQGMVIQVRCFWESATGNGGPTISPSQMRVLGALDIELLWDIWFADEESV